MDKISHLDITDSDGIASIELSSYSGLLLDFDGTVCDTDGIYDAALNEITYAVGAIDAYTSYKSSGVDIPIGTPWFVLIPRILKYCGIGCANVDDTVRRFVCDAEAHIDSGSVIESANDEVLDMMRRFHESGLPIAVATGTDITIVDRCLDILMDAGKLPDDMCVHVSGGSMNGLAEWNVKINGMYVNRMIRNGDGTYGVNATYDDLYKYDTYAGCAEWIEKKSRCADKQILAIGNEPGDAALADMFNKNWKQS